MIPTARHPAAGSTEAAGAQPAPNHATVTLRERRYAGAMGLALPRPLSRGPIPPQRAKILNTVAGRLPRSARRPPRPKGLVSLGLFAKRRARPPVEVMLSGRMFVVNKGSLGAGYLWCRKCEYAEPAPYSAMFGKTEFRIPHKNPRDGDPCPIEMLSHPIDLGHVFETDIRAIHFARPIPGGEAREGFCRTVAEAVKIACCRLLETDSRDLRAVTETKSSGVSVILSDTVAGGAGYCRRLVDDQRFRVSAIIAATREVLDCSNKACVTSCSRCLNEYSNQRHWDDFERQPCLHWLRSLRP